MLINVERGQNVIITKAGNKGRKTKIASIEIGEAIIIRWVASAIIANLGPNTPHP